MDNMEERQVEYWKNMIIRNKVGWIVKWCGKYGRK